MSCKWASLFIGALLRNLGEGGGIVCHDFEGKEEYISFLDPGPITILRFWGQASLLMGAQLCNLEWACLPGTLR
jgi:hypothetical protein